MSTLENDLDAVVKKLSRYKDKGRTMKSSEARDEPIVTTPVDKSLFTPLKEKDVSGMKFLAVDCSTITLRLAANWGVYLHRPVYSIVTFLRGKKRVVDEGLSKEKITAVVGTSSTRKRRLRHQRFDLESKTASCILKEHDCRNLLLDGAGYFGLGHGYDVSLYNECKRRNVVLLTVSKTSPTLHDLAGRDLLATINRSSSYSTWVYHPILPHDKDEHLYGDITAVKLCPDSPLVFRCDVMDYLTEEQRIAELISPLTAVSNDARCPGYPIPLYIADRYSTPSKEKILWYRDKVEERWSEAGIDNFLLEEEQSFNFAWKLHGLSLLQRGE